MPDKPGRTNKLDHVRNRLTRAFRDSAPLVREAEKTRLEQKLKKMTPTERKAYREAQKKTLQPNELLEQLDHTDEHQRARARALTEMMSSEVVQRLSGKLSPEQFQDELFKAFLEHAFDKDLRNEQGHQKLLEPLYKSMEIDPDILAADAQKQQKLRTLLSSLPQLAATYKDWEALSKTPYRGGRAKQLRTLRSVLDAISDAYGLREKPLLVLAPLEKMYGKGNLALYFPLANAIVIDPKTNHFTKGRSAAGSIVDTVIEEAIHAYQWQLVWDLVEKRLSKGDPRFREATKYLLNWIYPGMYVRSPPYDAYAGQPLERLPKKLQPWYP